jgi:hypothetical protein
MSTIAQLVRDRIDKLDPGAVFDYDTLKLNASEVGSVAQSLSRLRSEGVIERLEKGKYYKPKKSAYGRIRPSENEIIQLFTRKNNKWIGYLTGLLVYNKLGLTTQVSNTLVIATPNPKEPKELDGYKIRFVKSNADIREQDIPLLQILDAFQDISSIPDSSPDESLKVLRRKINALNDAEKKRLPRLAKDYRPRTRVLLGAFLECFFDGIATTDLKKNLNKLSTFELGVSEKALPNKSSWNIK